MMSRRRALRCFCLVGTSLLSGCFESFTGGQITGGADPSQLSGQKGDLVTAYEEAISERNDGVKKRDEAITAFNEEEYERSVGQFETALEYFQSAREKFGNAADLAREIGEEDAASICERAENDAKVQIDATRAGSKAARTAYQGGTSSDVNEHVTTYQDLVDRAETINVEDTESLFETLESE